MQRTTRFFNLGFSGNELMNFVCPSLIKRTHLLIMCACIWNRPTMAFVYFSIVSGESVVESVLNRPFRLLLPWIHRARKPKTETPCVLR